MAAGATTTMDVRRISDRRWTGALEAENAFQDAFPFLVASAASLAEVNRRLAAAGADPRLDGSLTFGMNAVIVEGIDRRLTVGMKGRAAYAF